MNALWIGFALALAQTANPQAFEVASVKEHVFAGPGDCRGGASVSGNRVTMPCMALRILIMRAYDVKAYQISGGPAWLSNIADTMYDVRAKAPGEEKPGPEQVRDMLQALLADRFQLRLHRETKDLPVYALVVGKGGPKLKESAADAKSSIGFRLGGISGRVTASAESMPQFALYLSNEAGRPVVDKTGLNSKYDFELDWTRAERQVIPGVSAPGGADSGVDSSGPSLFTAVQEQLGLRLEAQKAPIEMLVIEHAERPSGN